MAGDERSRGITSSSSPDSPGVDEEESRVDAFPNDNPCIAPSRSSEDEDKSVHLLDRLEVSSSRLVPESNSNVKGRVDGKRALDLLRRPRLLLRAVARRLGRETAELLLTGPGCRFVCREAGSPRSPEDSVPFWGEDERDERAAITPLTGFLEGFLEDLLENILMGFLMGFLVLLPSALL